MLRKNVAGQFLYFAGVNATTGAALTGATFSVRRSIDGTFAAGGGTITEDTGLGFYKCALTQADTNGNDLAFFFTATNAIPVCINVLTTAADPSDTVRYGLTALPNVASGSAGAIITSGTGTAQLSVSSGLVTLAGVTHTGAVIPTVTTVTNQLTAAQIATGVWQDTTAGDFTAANSIGKSVMNGVALGTGLTINGYTGNTPQTGDSFARIGAAGAGLTAVVAASVTAGVTVTTNNDKSGYELGAGGSASFTESYRADAATGTLPQLLYEIVAHLGESSIAATTKTIKKIDGSTTAATFTLNDATTPTSITRTT